MALTSVSVPAVSLLPGLSASSHLRATSRPSRASGTALSSGQQPSRRGARACRWQQRRRRSGQSTGWGVYAVSADAAVAEDAELSDIAAGKPSSGCKVSLEEALRKVDALLAADKDDQAVKVVQALQETSLLKGFGAAMQVPKRLYSLEDLRINKIDPASFLSPKDETLGKVRTLLLGFAAAGSVAATYALDLTAGNVLTVLVALLAFATADQIVNGGGLEALLLDALGRWISSTYSQRVAEHEAGHFLVSYLMGLLPKSYTLSSWDALRKYNAMNVQAGTRFVDNDYQREVALGKLSAGTLDQVSCVALAGVASEYINFERSEGGLGDIQQLDQLMRALQFSQKKADSQVRWAVLNTVSILRRHPKTLKALAQAMRKDLSVGELIKVVENGIASTNPI
eukprot:jgi/Chlat1/4912/Chrsp31S04784